MLAESISLFISLRERFKPTDAVNFGVLYVEALSRMDNPFSILKDLCTCLVKWAEGG